ncbi:MAG: nickel pincer cofactor biosynthesis protein LarC, partial [Planctomycetota bacterium]|nr:nickel pincer cofactor biosynthesis protein LarC [Planctomycetota bacterium]
MPHLHFDPFCGAAGDMILAALIDLGVEADIIEKELCRLGVGQIRLQAVKTKRSGIVARQIADVENPAAGHGPARRLSDMLSLVEKSPYASRVKDGAARAFRLLAEAEAAVHGVAAEEVHFHEISGLDTIVDVFGVFLGLEILGVTSITSSPPAVGSGTVVCAHGTFPVPAPATAEILRRCQIPFAGGPAVGELLTPTGAALLAVVSERFGPPPPLIAARLGYGAGSREIAGCPNLLRAIYGSAAMVDDEVIVEFRMALDDMTPVAVADLLERARQGGAVDAYALHATMKKSRPAMEIVVLAPLAKAEEVESLLFLHSTTFGLRRQWLPRRILQRECLSVPIFGHEIRVKVGYR